MRVLIFSNMFPSAGSSLGTFVERQMASLEGRGLETAGVVKRRTGFLGYLPFFYESVCFALLDTYDIAHAHYGFHSALLPLWLGRRPVVTTFHGSDALYEPGRNPLYRRMQRYVALRSNHIIASSSQVASTLVSEFGVDPSRITILSWGVDSRIFAPRNREVCRRIVGFTSHERVVLSIGRRSIHKGTDLVFSCARRMPGVKFVVIGEGAPMEGPPNCQLLGPVPNEEVPNWIGAADIVLQPSRREGTPVAVLEALACGIPVVASRVGGILNVITDGEEGLLVDSENIEGLVRKMELLFGQPDLRRRMGLKGRARVLEGYDMQAVAEKIQKIYCKVLNGGVDAVPASVPAAAPAQVAA